MIFMFNKEESKKSRVCKMSQDISLKKVGAFLVTMTLLLGNYNVAQADNSYHEKYEEAEVTFEEKIEYNRNNKEYDETLCELYQDGSYLIDDKIYGIGHVYIAYGYDGDELFFYLVCPKIGNVDLFTREKYNLDKVNIISLSDTTLFIELLEKKLLTYNRDYVMQFDMNRIDEINEMVANWDGKIHNLVPELDAYDTEEREIVKVKNNGTKR